MFQLTPVVKVLLIINALLFLGSQMIDDRALMLFPVWSENFRLWQPITHFFMHANFGHFFFNMFSLVMFGAALESVWGQRKFLFYYVFCALGAAALHMGIDYFEVYKLQNALAAFAEMPDYNSFMNFSNLVKYERLNPGFRETMDVIGGAYDTGTAIDTSTAFNAMESYVTLIKQGTPMLGASGAIFGLLVAFGMLFPESELMLLFLPFPIKAKYFIPGLMVIELFLGTNNFSWDNIAHFAHLGGALFGVILLLYWRRFGTRL